jgi:hypothetical protein
LSGTAEGECIALQYQQREASKRSRRFGTWNRKSLLKSNDADENERMIGYRQAIGYSGALNKSQQAVRTIHRSLTNPQTFVFTGGKLLAIGFKQIIIMPTYSGWRA